MKSTSTAIVLSLAAALLIAIPGASIAADTSGQSASWNDYGVKTINTANLGSGAGFLTTGTGTRHAACPNHPARDVPGRPAAAAPAVAAAAGSVSPAADPELAYASGFRQAARIRQAADDPADPAAASARYPVGQARREAARTGTVLARSDGSRTDAVPVPAVADATAG